MLPALSLDNKPNFELCEQVGISKIYHCITKFVTTDNTPLSVLMR